MGHVPSLCVLCSPCYSRWCYGQIWPLHHYNQCMGENREKHLGQLVGERVCQPDIFTIYRLGCELSYGSCPISLCAL